MPQSSQGNKITIGKADLESAARDGSMSPLDVDSLWTALNAAQASSAGSSSSAEPTEGGRFDLAQLAWYGGGALVIIAMGYFMALAQSLYGTGSTFGLSILYGLGFALLGERLRSQGARAPAGVLFTIAVLLVPLAAESGIELLHLFGYEHLQAQSLTLEAITALAAFVTVVRSRTSLPTAPLYGAFWMMSITLAWILSSSGESGLLGYLADYNHYNVISMLTGLVLLGVAIGVDSRFGRRAGEDYSWWGYLFGTAAFWIPLSLLDSGGEFGKLVYFAINLLLMVASVVLARRVLLWAGAIGAIYYVGHLLGTFFSNSLGLPVALIALGVGIIYLGIQYRKRQAAIESAILSAVPEGLRKRLPGRSR